MKESVQYLIAFAFLPACKKSKCMPSLERYGSGENNCVCKNAPLTSNGRIVGAGAEAFFKLDRGGSHISPL